MQMINIVVADHFILFADGLVAALHKQGNAMPCRVVGVAHRGDALPPLLNTYKVQLLLLDAQFPFVANLPAFVQTLKSQHPDLLVLLISSFYDAHLINNALKAGANGCFLRSQDETALSAAVLAVFNGDSYLPPQAISSANMTLQDTAWSKSDYNTSQVFPGANPQQFIKTHSLTKRELEILKLISQALSNKEIAQALFISVQTVSVHRKNIMRKIGVSNTAGLIKVAYENCLV